MQLPPLPLLMAWVCSPVALLCVAPPGTGGGGFSPGHQEKQFILSWKNCGQERRSQKVGGRSGTGCRRYWMSWGRTVSCPGSAPRGGGTGRVGCSHRSGLCPACRKAQSKVLIKAAVRKQECPGRQTETPSERCGLCLVPTCLKAFHKCVVQRWG